MFEHCIRSRVEDANPKKTTSTTDRMTFDCDISEHRINSAIVYYRKTACYGLCSSSALHVFNQG